MIAQSISDMMDANAACARIAELNAMYNEIGVPDAICIRNDSFSEEPFSSMMDLVSTLWPGKIILESDSPMIITRTILRVLDRKPLLVGANSSNIEDFSTAAKLFDCPMCISCEDEEQLFDLVQIAESAGVKEIVLDPMMRNMKQCLELCTDIKRLSEMIPEAKHPIAVRTWSGEYAMTMAMVSTLVDDVIVIVDYLDRDSCETLSALLSAVR
jgi:CO dehydrogenase/acetyl-CoA synthase gamma subunit (corrinoid Fe-S protein)